MVKMKTAEKSSSFANFFILFWVIKSCKCQGFGVARIFWVAMVFASVKRQNKQSINILKQNSQYHNSQCDKIANILHAGNNYDNIIRSTSKQNLASRRTKVEPCDVEIIVRRNVLTLSCSQVDRNTSKLKRSSIQIVLKLQPGMMTFDILAFWLLRHIGYSGIGYYVLGCYDFGYEVM